MIGGLVQFVAITLQGIRHELDPSGGWCVTCNEDADYLLEVGGEGSF